MVLELPQWPIFGLEDDIRPALKAAMAAGEASALVTLYALDGGGPRPLGAQMLFTATSVRGFLSGGCVEGDVALHAERTLADGQARRLVYGEGSPWPDIRLLCGARMDLLVERVAADDLAARTLLALSDARRPLLWRSDGQHRRVEAVDGVDGEGCEALVEPFEIVRRYEPTPRLVVVGGDPTALATAQLGAQAGFETTLVRPKGPAEPPPGLAGFAYSRAEPAEALAAVGLDPWTAVAVATHDWEIDEAALVAALPSPAAYVGVLGARRRLPERMARLRAAGVGPAALARLKGPIGLDLGGKAPWEVAVAVVGEIIAERSARAGGSLSGDREAEAEPAQPQPLRNALG
jgi:xanthine dehydrogenase accessory factor